MNSPALKNPKKPRQHAAQSIILSGSELSWSQTALMHLKVLGPTGSLSLFSPPFSASILLMPRRVYCRRFRCGSKGSLKPSAICRNLTADRYDLMEQCFRLLLARWVQSSRGQTQMLEGAAAWHLYKISNTYFVHYCRSGGSN